MTTLRNDYIGGAAATSLATGIGPTDDTITAPTGGFATWTPVVANRIGVVINHGQVDEERCYATDVTGDTLTGLTRGEDGTVARSHDAGATVTHGLFASDVDEPNAFLASPTAAGQVAVSDAAGSWGTPSSTLAGITLTAPTITDFTNAQHDHGDTNDGGALVAPAIADFTNAQHDHLDADDAGLLTQAATHQSPDTDTATSALHHTLGTGANQAAPGNHTHTVAVGEGVWLGPSQPNTWFTNSTIATNRALYARIRPTADVTVSAIYFALAAGAGNIDVGIYADASGAPGTKIVSSGSTASPGAGLHGIAVTPTVLTAGTTYWIAFAMSSASLELVCTGSSSSYGGFTLYTTFAGEHTSGFPLPTTASALTADAIAQGMAVGVLLP